MNPRIIPSNKARNCRTWAASRDPGVIRIPYRGFGLIILVGTIHDTSLLYVSTRGRRVNHPCPTLMQGGSTAHYHASTTCHIALAVTRRLPSPHTQAMRTLLACQVLTPPLLPAYGRWQVHPHFPYSVKLHYPRPPPRLPHFLRDAKTKEPASRLPEVPTSAVGVGLLSAHRYISPLPPGRSSGHPGSPSRHLRDICPECRSAHLALGHSIAARSRHVPHSGAEAH